MNELQSPIVCCGIDDNERKFHSLLNFPNADGYGYDHHDHDNDNDEDIEKTLAILIGLIAGVALIIVFLSFLRKVLEGKGMSLIL